MIAVQYTGTVLSLENDKTCVFTSGCEMVQIRTKKGYSVGSEIRFTHNDLCVNRSLRLPSLRTLLPVLAAVLVLALSLGLFLHFLGGSPATVCAAVVSVDINPGVELSLDGEGRILEASPRNEDGDILLRAAPVTGMPLEQGLGELCSMARNLGYLNDDNNLVLVTAALSDGEADGSDTYMDRLRDILGTFEQTYADAEVLTVLAEDPDILRDARENDLTLGKELLYRYATAANIGLTAADIRNAALTELVNALGVRAGDGSIDDTLIRQAANPSGAETTTVVTTATDETHAETSAATTAPATTAATTASSSAAASSSTAATASVVTTAATTTATTGSAGSYFLSASLSGSRLLFSWTPLPDSPVTHSGTSYSGFKYYKVVASETNPTPMYPDDGYLYVGSDRKKTAWSVDPAADSYNKSPALVPGRSYYFAVTYVFENGRFSSNAVRLTLPGADAATTASTAASFGPPQLSVTGSGSSLLFVWTRLPGNTLSYGGKTYTDFRYYKVVASETNPSPVYPDDGYLYMGSDIGNSSWTVDTAGSGYNPSPVLIPGHSYYFAITYMFENGNFCSNTVLYKLPGAGAATTAATSSAAFGPPVLTLSASESVLSFSWTKLPGAAVLWQGKQYTGFQFYKAVASETNPNPSYPDDGYLYAGTDTAVSDWSVDITETVYNKSPALTAGKTYYFSITYVFQNGKFSSNTVQLKLPG